MIPSWKFRSVPGLNHAAAPFYLRPWPDDLPEKCGNCGTEFRFGFNLTIGPGKMGRILRGIAYCGALPFLLLGGFMIPVGFPEFFGNLRGNHTWWAIFGGMFLPPMILAGISAIMPRTRLVECKKCGWSHDYNFPKLRELNPTSPLPSQPSNPISTTSPQQESKIP